MVAHQKKKVIKAQNKCSTLAWEQNCKKRKSEKREAGKIKKYRRVLVNKKSRNGEGRSSKKLGCAWQGKKGGRKGEGGMRKERGIHE